MSTEAEIRQIRLENDHRQMVNMKGPIIDWVAAKGEPPFVEEYLLTINVRTIISSAPTYRDQTKIRLVLPANYPRGNPQAHAIDKPYPFHPNWWGHGLWCWGSWYMTEGLGEYVLRMVRTLQFDPTIANVESVANPPAAPWYNSALRSGLLPCDRQVLPDPDAGPAAKRKKFVIKST